MVGYQWRPIAEIQADFIKRQAQKEAELARRPTPLSYIIGDLGTLTFSQTHSSAYLDLTDEYSAKQAQNWNESLFDPKQKWISESHFADDMFSDGFGSFTVNLTLSLFETNISENYMECIHFSVDLGKDAKGSYGYFLFMKCHQQGRDVKLNRLKMPGKEALVRFCKELHNNYSSAGPGQDTTYVIYTRARQGKATIEIRSQIDKQPDNPYNWLGEAAEKLTSYL